MPRATYGKKWGRVHTTSVKDKSQSGKSVEDIVRDLKREQQKPRGEDR